MSEYPRPQMARTRWMNLNGAVAQRSRAVIAAGSQIND
jgi:hypothetical protein